MPDRGLTRDCDFRLAAGHRLDGAQPDSEGRGGFDQPAEGARLAKLLDHNQAREFLLLLCPKQSLVRLPNSDHKCQHLLC